MIWIAVGACLLCSFVFSGIEAGILSVNRVRLKHRVKMRDAAAIKLSGLLANPERLLVTVLLVTNLMNITAIALTTQELARWFGGRGYLLALALFLPANLFLLEVLPKSLFRRFPYRALALLAEPLRLADLLLAPMHWIGWRLSRLFLRHQPAGRQKLFIAREDFKHFTVESERVGALSRPELEMIHNVIDFRAIKVRDVMAPLSADHTAPGSMRVAALVERSQASGLQRWPVLDEAGLCTGVVDVFDLLREARRHDRIEVHQRRMVRLSPHELAYSALRRLRAGRAPLGIVGEAGAAPLGVVTTADLVRRLVDTASSRSSAAPAS